MPDSGLLETCVGTKNPCIYRRNHQEDGGKPLRERYGECSFENEVEAHHRCERGDRNGAVQQSGLPFVDASGAPVVSAQSNSGIFDERNAFKSFNVAFPGLDGATADTVIRRFVNFSNPQIGVIGAWAHNSESHGSPYGKPKARKRASCFWYVALYALYDMMPL